MSEKLDAHKVADDVVTALNSEDDNASQTMLQEVNADLRKLSEPERNLVANDLSLRGVLPNLALETGLVSQDTFVTKDSLAKVAAEEGSSSVKGLSAKFLSENFTVIGGGVRQDINADYVSGFDTRYDMALDTAQAKREFGGLLDVLKKQNPDNADIRSRDGLQAGDIDALLARPDALTADQTSALKTMKDNFEYMKTPRGVWTLTDWTTPRVTGSSLDEFVDNGVPLGMREQLRIAEQEKSKQAGILASAQLAQSERLAPLVVPVESTAKTDAPVTQPEVPPVKTELPPTKTETPPAAAELPPAKTEISKEETETPPVDSEKTQDVPPVKPEMPPAPMDTPPAEQEAPMVDSAKPPAKLEVPSVSPETPPTQTDALPVQPESPPAKDETNPAIPEKPDSLPKDSVSEKEIEVVQGDNLWKIARAHLRELEGKRPSDADVLELVNEIVKLNEIKNPDLIYPGQRFKIPHAAAPMAVAPDAVVPVPGEPPKV